MSKHDGISQELRGEIAAGKYGKSGKLPSEAQLVERFGVSRPTVARALRALQGEDLVFRKAGSGTFVRRNAESFAQAEVLGLLVPERGTTEIFDAICGELGALARMQGTGILWGGSTQPYADLDSSPEHAKEICQEFIDKGVTGVFFAPLEMESDLELVNQQILDLFRQAGIPVVLLDRDFKAFPTHSRFDLVCMDNFCAGYLLAEHLLRLGCKSLRFVARSKSATTIYARISGAREAIRKYGLEWDGDFEAWGDPNDLKFVRSLQAGILCDGILCANDITAAELMKSLEKLKIGVPDGVRIVGFDNLRHATLVRTPLTTIHQPCREIAEVAFRAMQERISMPTLPKRTLSLAPRLVVRESCGAYLKR